MINWKSVELGKLEAEMLLFSSATMVKVFSGLESDWDGVEILLDARSSPQTVNGWEYSITTTDKSSTILATYVANN